MPSLVGVGHGGVLLSCAPMIASLCFTLPVLTSYISIVLPQVFLRQPFPGGLCPFSAIFIPLFQQKNPFSHIFQAKKRSIAIFLVNCYHFYFPKVVTIKRNFSLDLLKPFGAAYVFSDLMKSGVK